MVKVTFAHHGSRSVLVHPGDRPGRMWRPTACKRTACGEHRRGNCHRGNCHRAPPLLAQPGGKDRPAGWRKDSHSNDVPPNYDVVFPIDAVNTITITIAPDDWAAMEADMEDIYAPSLYIRKAILAAGPDLSQEEREKLLVELFASRPVEQPPGASPVTGAEETDSDRAGDRHGARDGHRDDYGNGCAHGEREVHRRSGRPGAAGNRLP